jgi:peptidoglycan/LPS O-acetylase OafA/YrhL
MSLPPIQHVQNADQLTYRCDIDGLRAIAVLSVLGFHAFPQWMKGGFIGVDIFFVISGFLITNILYKHLHSEHFSLLDFYSRRVRRIFPALILVLICCFIFGWFSLLADEFALLGKHIASGAAFVSNLVLWQESGYFDVAAETKPLLHLWSLGIEEQFYIFWPLILWLSWQQKINLLKVTLFLLFLSFTLNIWLHTDSRVADFYSPLTRAWELLAGGALALYQSKKSPSHFDDFISNNKPFLSAFGLVLLATGFLFITKERHFPGYWAILPTAGTLFLIYAGKESPINKYLLSNRVLVWFGLISFPLYLWHWPLLSFARIFSDGDDPSRLIRIGALVLSIALAWLTKNIVEQPIRFGQHGKSKSIVLTVLMLLVGTLGYLTYINNGFPNRLKNLPVSIELAKLEIPAGFKSIIVNDWPFYQKKSDKKQTSLFIGDSNALHLYPRVDELINRSPKDTNSAIFSFAVGCLPIPETNYIDASRGCSALMLQSLKFIESHPEIQKVILSGNWYEHLSGNGHYFNDGHARHPISLNSTGYKLALETLGQYIKKLQRLGKEVYFVLNIPIGAELHPKHLIQRSILDFPHVLSIREGGLSYQSLMGRYGQIRTDLINMANKNGAILIDPEKSLCTENLCSSVDRFGAPIYLDSTHLHPTYTRQHADFIDQTVVDTLKK